MAFLIVGVLLLVCKMADFGPVATWSWWLVLLPFFLAAAWWSFSDSIGLTQRRAMQKMEDRKTQRRDKAMEALGLDYKRSKQVGRARASARQAAADAPPVRVDDGAGRRDPRP
jgi:small Trp-rich protein